MVGRVCSWIQTCIWLVPSLDELLWSHSAPMVCANAMAAVSLGQERVLMWRVHLAVPLGGATWCDRFPMNVWSQTPCKANKFMGSSCLKSFCQGQPPLNQWTQNELRMNSKWTQNEFRWMPFSLKRWSWPCSKQNFVSGQMWHSSRKISQARALLPQNQSYWVDWTLDIKQIKLKVRTSSRWKWIA